MKPSIILNPKFIAVLAIIYGAQNLFQVTEFDSTTASGLIWIAAGIFVWRKSIWANVAIVFLASLDFIRDIIPEIPKFHENISEFTLEFNLPDNVIAFLIIFSMSLQCFFIYCFIYHGIHTLFKRDHA